MSLTPLQTWQWALDALLADARDELTEREWLALVEHLTSVAAAENARRWKWAA